MRKYINAAKLVRMIENDEVLFRELTPFLRQRILNIIDECPNVGSVSDLPIKIGAKIVTADGRAGEVDSIYLGTRGIQRIFARMGDGEKYSFKPKDIGIGVFISDGENSRSECLEDKEGDYASDSEND